MRKISVLVLLAALVFSPLPAMSAFKGPDSQIQESGGYSGPISGAAGDTVSKVWDLGDDAPVVLTGHIVSQLAGKKDKFIFKDQTGEIKVEIGRKTFRGQNITPQDTVRISGKVDKDFGEKAEIDVKQIEILK